MSNDKDTRRADMLAGANDYPRGNYFIPKLLLEQERRLAELEAEVSRWRNEEYNLRLSSAEEDAYEANSKITRLREALKQICSQMRKTNKFSYLTTCNEALRIAIEALKGTESDASTQAEVAQEDDTDGGEAVSAEAQNEAAAKTETKESLKPLKLLYPMSVIEWRNALMKRDAEIAEAIAKVRQEHADLALWQFRAASEKGDQDRLIEKMQVQIDALTEAVLKCVEDLEYSPDEPVFNKLREMKGGE
jgi:hypothetical protein